MKFSCNIPNILTIVRLVLVAVYIALFSAGETYIALVMFLFAGVTDLLDGYIARKYHQITEWGMLMDPFADKMMILTVLLSFWIVGWIPFAIILIMGLKEALMIIGSIFLYRKKRRTVYSKFLGKFTALFTCSVIVLTFFKEFIGDVHLYLLYVATLFNVISFGFYAYVNYIAPQKANKNRLFAGENE